MGKRHVHTAWTNLIPDLCKYLSDPSEPSSNIEQSKLALEAIKMICKKYRFMFRSDALY